jgi:MatE
VHHEVSIELTLVRSLLWFFQWEVLTLFAAYMGPAEVAAWGIVGYVWSAFEAITEAFGDGAEVRVGFRMGAGQIEIAKKVTEKGIYIGFLVAIFCCGLNFTIAPYLPGWLTPDPILQKLIFDMLPLIGFGQILMVPGFVAWAIIGAQGRVRLATFIEFFVSWFVSMPLAAILTYGFNFNLEGIVGALIIGYTIGANMYLYVLCKSDWEALSAVVVARNAAEGLLYDEFEWDDLPAHIQDAAMTLGYTQEYVSTDVVARNLMRLFVPRNVSNPKLPFFRTPSIDFGRKTGNLKVVKGAGTNLPLRSRQLPPCWALTGRSGTTKMKTTTAAAMTDECLVMATSGTTFRRIFAQPQRLLVIQSKFGMPTVTVRWTTKNGRN